MTDQERDTRLQEALKLAELIEIKSIRARTIYTDWSLLETKITDYIEYLESYKDRHVEPDIMEYLNSYITAEYERLTKLGG